MIECFLFIILIASGLIQLVFWLGIYSRVVFYKDEVTPHSIQNVSVIVVAKNEEKYISSCINAIAQEKSLISEIIVVDDFSSDKTPSIINELCKDDDRIKYLKPSKNLPGKKLALTEAIEFASSEILLLTDADCVPSSEDWATLMSSKLDAEKEIVLGYSPIIKSTGYINLWSRFETWLTAFQYLSFTLAGLQYMGVGRNLMYRKSLFLKNNGFQSHSSTISGDDDLFINQVANKTNTAICLSPRSFVFTESVRSFREYILQKKRHYSVSHEYKTKHIIILSLFSISHMLFYLSTIILLSTGKFVAIPTIVTVLILKWIVAFLGMKKMKENLWPMFPLLDIALVIYYIAMSPFLFIKAKSW